MEIVNDLPEELYLEYDEFLAYVGIYDDKLRIERYKKFIKKLNPRDKVCVEAGAGYGVFAEFMLKLGADKVYVVERNRFMLNILREKFGNNPRVEIISCDIKEFIPEDDIYLLVHDFYGTMLYDEDLHAVEELKFKPGNVLPDAGRLMVAVVNADDYLDTTVNRKVLEQFKGVLVTDLFVVKNTLVKQLKGVEVLHWHYESGLRGGRLDISNYEGDLLVFWVELVHGGQLLCRAGECFNWPLVWTPRAGDVFEIGFTKRGAAPYFKWIR
ncbi:hypothetical protein J7J56_05105 [candidate division WOR-3 bacterium]|nr:hypothetical protein [candidate division WOR-3 bacterium]